jgi:uncharacterized membrane protein
MLFQRINSKTLNFYLYENIWTQKEINRNVKIPVEN